MGPESTGGSKRMGWQIYLGVGILSAVAGYALSAMPRLIFPMVCLGLAVGLIWSGLKRRQGRLGGG